MKNDPDITALKRIVNRALKNKEGHVADYIPELANVDHNLAGVAIWKIGEEALSYSNKELKPTTLQSTAKIIPLIGLLEEIGHNELFKLVRVEPSGDDFASITRLEQFGPKPSNPMLNAGAITLCSHIPGRGEQQYAWLDHWVAKLFRTPLRINPSVFASEKRTGDRNRSLAYLLHSRKRLATRVKDTLDLYFSLCSYEATLEQTLYLPTILANRGLCPITGNRVISETTCKITVAVMATCGLYDESGTHMVRIGIPAKSGVSGYIIGTVPGVAGISVYSPLVNEKGNSIRGELILEDLSDLYNWHFATLKC